MKFLILIPSYLWKNTLKRWCENPISPFSKILIPVLLSLLATLILVFFIETEQQLIRQLQQVDSYSALISERVQMQSHRGVSVDKTLAEEHMWKSKYGAANIRYIRQPNIPVKWNGSSNIPIILYTASEYHSFVKDGGATPEILFLNSIKLSRKRYETIELHQSRVSARCEEMPEFVQDHYKGSYVLAVPIEVADRFVAQGFTMTIKGSFDNFQDVESFVFDMESYYHAERRQIRVVSALSILEGIERIKKIQYYVRVGVVFSCGVILALILGTIAWLEFRHESYLMALLRSFGTPSWILLIHAFLENLLLVSLGIYLSFIAWQPLYGVLKGRISIVNLRSASAIDLPLLDTYIIYGAGLLGVLVAMIPIAFGLRKQPGLILQ